MTLFERSSPNPAGHGDVTPLDVVAGREGVRVVDVREKDELTGELGRMPGVEHVPLADVERAMAGWDRNQEIVLVCRSGNRSGKAATKMAAAGFSRVMNMVGGMLAYNAAGLPVERD